MQLRLQICARLIVDVRFRWAFGVVVWEIFSLAQTPYPGQAVDRNFIRWLKSEENRMLCPDYAPEKMYVKIFGFIH